MAAPRMVWFGRPVRDLAPGGLRLPVRWGGSELWLGWLRRAPAGGWRLEAGDVRSVVAGGATLEAAHLLEAARRLRGVPPPGIALAVRQNVSFAARVGGRALRVKWADRPALSGALHLQPGGGWRGTGRLDGQEWPTLLDAMSDAEGRTGRPGRPGTAELRRAWLDLAEREGRLRLRRADLRRRQLHFDRRGRDPGSGT